MTLSGHFANRRKPEMSNFLDECQRVKKPRTRSTRASALSTGTGRRGAGSFFAPAMSGKWDRSDDTWRLPTSASSFWRSKFLELAVSRSFSIFLKTHEDEEDPGVVPIIAPLRFVLDAIKPENASGWMFPNTIGGALDLDNSSRPSD